MHGRTSASVPLGLLAGQVGVGEQLAAHGHEVESTGGDRRIGVDRIETPEADDRDRDGPAKGGGERQERAAAVGRVPVGDADGHVRVGVRRDVDGVDARLDRQTRRHHRLVGLGAAGLVRLRGVEPDPHREVRAHASAHRGDHLEQEPGPARRAIRPTRPHGGWSPGRGRRRAGSRGRRAARCRRSPPRRRAPRRPRTG